MKWARLPLLFMVAGCLDFETPRSQYGTDDLAVADAAPPPDLAIADGAASPGDDLRLAPDMAGQAPVACTFDVNAFDDGCVFGP